MWSSTLQMSLMNPGFNSVRLSSKIKIDDGKLVFDVVEKINDSKLEIKSLGQSEGTPPCPTRITY